MVWFLMGVMIFVGLIVYLTGFFIQNETSKGVFFGVRTPEKFLKREDFKALEKGYKKNWSKIWLVATVMMSLLMLLVSNIMTAGVLIIYIFGITFLLNFCYYKTHKKVKAIKVNEDWSGYFINDNIVIVDLKKEEQEKNYSKFFLIPIILVIICVVINIICYLNGADNMILHTNASGVVDRWGQKGSFSTIFEKIIFMPLVSVGFTAFFWGMNKIIYKAKNHINGGEVNEIMEQKRQFRKGGSWIFLICNIQVIVMMEGINIMSFSNKAPGIWFYLLTVVGGFIPLIPILFFSYKIGQGGSKLKVKGKIEGDKLIINRDDDDNYVWGTMYYNRQDPALFVEKRVGFGWDLNFGNKKAKWFFAPIVVILLGVMILLFVLLPSSVKPRDISITDKCITISGFYGETINREDIEKVTLEKMPKVTFKTNGASIDGKDYGNYKINYNDQSIKAKLYVENEKLQVVIIQTRDGKIYLINRNDENKTKEFYEKIK